MTLNGDILENPLIRDFLEQQDEYNPAIGDIVELFVREIEKENYTSAVVAFMKAKSLVNAINMENVKLPNKQDVNSLLFTLLMSEYCFNKITCKSYIREVKWNVENNFTSLSSFFVPFFDKSGFFVLTHTKYTTYYNNAMEIIFKCRRRESTSELLHSKKLIIESRRFFKEFSLVWLYQLTQYASGNAYTFIDGTIYSIYNNLVELSYINREREVYQLVPMSIVYRMAKGEISPDFIKSHCTEYFNNYIGVVKLDKRFMENLSLELPVFNLR